MQRNRLVPGSKHASELGYGLANLTEQMDSAGLLMVWCRATCITPCSGISSAILVVVVVVVYVADVGV